MNILGELVICIQHICMNFSSLNLRCFPQSSVISALKHYFCCALISNLYMALKTVTENLKL